MATDCPRLLFLLVEDWLSLSPHLIDLYSVAVSSTKLCVHTITYLLLAIHFVCPHVLEPSPPSPQEKPGDMALYPCFRLHYCLCGTLNMVSVPPEVLYVPLQILQVAHTQ